MPYSTPRNSPISSTHQAWLALWELGWSIDRLASTWNQSPDHLTTILNDLSQHPLPSRVRSVPQLPTTPNAAHRLREIIRQLYHHGWTIGRLAETFPYYNAAFISELVKKSRMTPPAEKRCACGCTQGVWGRQKWATPGCRKRTQRKTRTHPKAA
jgi:hypothetical protein